MASRQETIEALLRPTVEALGFELWGVEYNSQGRNTLLRLYIDAEDGVNVDDCARVSHQISAVLDVEDPIRGEYPAYVGEWIELRLRSPFEGRRKFKGTLKGVEGEDIVIQIDDQEFLLPHSAVEKAQVRPRLEK